MVALRGVLSSLLLFVPCLSVFCSPALAQDETEETRDGRRFWVGAGVGYMVDTPLRFSNSALCPRTRATQLSFALGYRILSVLGVEGSATVHMQETDICINGLPEPIPDMGPFTRTFVRNREGVRGYPFESAEVRVVVDPLTASFASVRGIGGFAWMFEKDIAAGLGGVGLRVGPGRLRATLDLEAWLFGVPVERVERNYLDGELISETVTKQSFLDGFVNIRFQVQFFP